MHLHSIYNVVVEVRKNNPYFNPFICIKYKTCNTYIFNGLLYADLKHGKSSAGLSGLACRLFFAMSVRDLGGRSVILAPTCHVTQNSKKMRCNLPIESAMGSGISRNSEMSCGT